MFSQCCVLALFKDMMSLADKLGTQLLVETQRERERER